MTISPKPSSFWVIASRCLSHQNCVGYCQDISLISRCVTQRQKLRKNQRGFPGGVKLAGSNNGLYVSTSETSQKYTSNTLRKAAVHFLSRCIFKMSKCCLLLSTENQLGSPPPAPPSYYAPLYYFPTPNYTHSPHYTQTGKPDDRITKRHDRRHGQPD